MTKCSHAPRSTVGTRLILAVTLGLGVELACPALASATDAIAVTLDEDESTVQAAPVADDNESKVKRRVAPYSLPWQLRPVVPLNLVRSDTSFSFYGVDGASIVSGLSASYKVMPRVAVLARLTIAEDSPPIGAGGFGFANPLIGGQIGFWPAKSVKLSMFLGVTIPVGMGGGVSPDAGSQDVNLAAMFARSGFENPLYMPDYLGGWPGIDIAYVTSGFTFQAEINMGFLARVRGPQTEKSSNVDLSMGLHAGYFIFPFASFGIDLRHARWLTTPIFVAQDLSHENKDVSTIALGPRAHVKLGDGVWWRPGLSLTLGLDRPVASSHYKTIQVDLPFSF